MKPEGQNRDNLEQFFRQQLESYTADPSPDFWEEMVDFIPQKPPFWMVWAGNIQQSLFPLLLLSSLVALSWLYWKALAEKENLSQLSQNQQSKITVIEAQNNSLKNQLKVGGFNDEQKKITESSFFKTRELLRVIETIQFPKARKARIFIEKPDPETVNTAHVGVKYMIDTGQSASLSLQPPSIIGDVQLAKVMLNKAQSIGQEEKLPLAVKTHSKLPFTNFKHKAVASLLPANKISSVSRINPKDPLLSNAQIKGGFLSKDRCSFEGGTLVFYQKVNKDDELLLGKQRAAFGASLLVNYKVNDLWKLQSGVQVKNIPSGFTTRSYMAIPLNARRVFSFDKGIFFESSLGATMHLKMNSKAITTAETIDVNPSYLDIRSSVALGLPFNQNLHFVIEPNIAYATTAVYEKQKAFSYGLQVGIRYQN